MKVAIVHEFLNQYGGGERVLEAIHEIFPHSHVYTTLYDPAKLPLRMRRWDVRPFDLPNLRVRHFLKYLTAFYPFLFERLDLSDYDLVISSSANFAKGIITGPKTVHISYIHTPPRFLYHYPTETGKREKFIYRPVLAVLDNFLRIWDYHAGQRPDFLIANSRQVAGRILKFYGREATVIYPPVELPNQPEEFYFRSADAEGKKVLEPKAKGFYYLLVSRLVSYKNIELVIQAANRLKVLLKIVGTGRDEERLRKMANSEVEFLGFVGDDKLSVIYSGCQAFIFPTDEDFGITPVEAMLFGKPVLALAKGGALETILVGKTGEFFSEPTVESLVEAWRNFDPSKYKSANCIAQAKRFSKDRFLKEFRAFVASKLR